MQKVIIIDDEQNAREVIASIIKRKIRQLQIVATPDSVHSGLLAIKEHNPDIVLLDIQMHDGSGFDLLKKLKTIDFKVIFITAHKEYALKAIKFSAIDYVIKPIDADELVEAIKKAMEAVDHKYIVLSLEAHKNNFLHEKEPKKIILRTFDSVYSINVNDIVRLEADGNYTRFFLYDRQKIMVSTIIKEYDELLSEYGFFRTHQSHLINMAYFIRFKKDDGGFAVLKNDFSVPVSSRKRELFMQVIDELGK